MYDYAALMKEKRVKLGYSQHKLAHLAGISQPFVNQIEHGTRKPSLDVLIRIFEVLDIPLFGGQQTHE